MKKTLKAQQKEKNEVAELLRFFEKYQEPDLSSAILIRQGEVDSFLRVIQVALENQDHDERFFVEHVGRTTSLLRQRYEELQLLMGAYIEQKETEKDAKAAA